jgi:hypothetical protein
MRNSSTARRAAAQAAKAHQLLAPMLQRRHLLGAGKVLQHHKACSRPNSRQQTKVKIKLGGSGKRGAATAVARRPPPPTPTPTHHRAGTDPAAPGWPSCACRDVLGWQPLLPAAEPALSAKGLSSRGLWCFLWSRVHTVVTFQGPASRAMPCRRAQSAEKALPPWLLQESRHLEAPPELCPFVQLWGLTSHIPALL